MQLRRGDEIGVSLRRLPLRVKLGLPLAALATLLALVYASRQRRLGAWRGLVANSGPRADAWGLEESTYAVLGRRIHAIEANKPGGGCQGLL